jgi:CubicO group peptidase (beta-lactamase class C family)
MARISLLVLGAVLLAPLTDGATLRAQNRYSMIGTDAQATGPVLWDEDAGRAEIFAKVMEAWASDGGFSGVVLAAYDGRVAYRGAFGKADHESDRPITLDTPFRIGFMSAYFTAVSVAILAEEKRLALDHPIGRYIDGLRADIGETTIEHLLSGRDGLDRDFWRHTSKTFADEFSRQELMSLINRLERIAPPGDQYHGPGPDGAQPHYLLLGLLIEGLTGQPFEDFVLGHIIVPLELRRTGFLTRGQPDNLVSSYHELLGERERYSAPDASHLFSSGAVYSTIDDLYLFVTQVLDEKRFGELAVTAFKLHSFDLAFALVDDRLVRDDEIPVSARRFHTGGSNGWMRGETVLYQQIFDSGDVIIALSNVHRAAEIYDIRRRFARLKFGLPVGAPLPKTKRRLWDLLVNDGIDPAAEFFAATMASGGGAGDLPWPDQFMHHSRELRKLERFEEALLVTELYIRTQPDFYLPYREMGEIHRAMGENEEALSYFRKSLDRDPDHVLWRREMEAFISEHSRGQIDKPPVQ